ncbi:MAG: hypothetical protein HRT65_10970 [Flavobacteriaceae bacterium]|uniref:hypothetical protein n=1 Tax=Flagellimonas algarum TaxID=3230298 RepID=UPI0033940E1B|nr:hypothetical protein [Flavobacteriaceae bacterium]
MRKISVICAVALMAFGTATANVQPEETTKKLSTQIHKMLETNSFDIVDDLTANVRFTINKEGEIVVLSVDTDDQDLEGFVKGRLNYQKVDITAFKEGKMYTVPVRIAA